jgi:ParB family chromosome partitioning protein
VEIEAHVYEKDDAPQKAVAFIENLQRRQLELSEEVKAVIALMEEYSLSVEAIAARLSKSRSWVLSRMAVPNLPEYIREPLLEGDLKLGQVEEICRVEDDGARRYVTAQAIQGRMTRAAIRGLVENVLANPAVQQAGEWGDKVNRGEVEIKPIMVTVGCCQTLQRLEETMLVRVCAHGYGCQSVESRADQANS